MCPSGVVHWYKMPGPALEPVPLIVICGLAQVMAPAVAAATGGVVFSLTSKEKVAVQPFAPFVTVNV